MKNNTILYEVKDFFQRHSIFILFSVAFLLMLLSYNKYWAPYDEGNYLNAPSVILKGMIPYRDFFYVMYTPGHAYFMAGLLKLFGMNLLVGRLYNILLLSGICTTVFYITKTVVRKRYALISFVVCLVTMCALGEPPIPRAVWPGVFLSMIAIAFMISFIYKENRLYFIASSFFVALATMFRHDIGFLTFVASSVGIVLYAIHTKEKKPTIKRIVGFLSLYSALPVIFLTALGVWLYQVGAFNDAVNAMFVLPSKFHKWAGIPFPGFCFDFNMIFHRGCLFIKKNQFYIPIIMCGISTVLFGGEILSKKKLDKRIISLSVLIVLGIAYLQQLVFRVDSNHLAASFPPIAVLFGVLFSYRLKSRALNILRIIFISFAILLVTLFLYKGIEKYIKDILIKPFVKKSIIATKFERGSVYIPDDVRDNFVELVEYINDNTVEGDRIYIGNLNHNVPQMGWFDLIYFLTDRTPAVKYFILIPGLQSRDDIQKEMILSLEENNAKLILLRDYGNADNFGPLDNYIRKEYKLDIIKYPYYIYVKK